MIKSYKNQIFQYLLNHPSGINSFSIADTDQVLTVKYAPFGNVFCFQFLQSKDSFDNFGTKGTNYKPDYPFVDRTAVTTRPYSFGYVFEDFKHWCDNELSRFIENESQIDLWEDYIREINIEIDRDFSFNNLTSFDSSEKEKIVMALNEVRLLIHKRFVASTDEGTIVDNRINYLIEALNRLNKIDWKGIFINTIISITVALSLDSEKGRELFNLFLQFIQRLPEIGK